MADAELVNLSGGTPDIPIATDLLYGVNAAGDTDKLFDVKGLAGVTPIANANITAVSATISITAPTITLTANASYVLTSAPTIANGVDGQRLRIINVDTVDTITIQDQGTLASSNLRLNAPTIALAPGDSIDLEYNATIADWVQVPRGSIVAPHSNTTKVTAAGATSSSSTFVNLNVSCAVTIIKHRANTKLLIAYDGSIYNDNGFGEFEVAVQVNGTDYPIARGYSTMQPSGTIEVTGLAAGSWTCTLRKRVANATGLVVDGAANTFNTLTATETL